MHHVGHKLEVPKHDDVKGWETFYDQVTAPGYGRWSGVPSKIDRDRDRENEHWERCRIRLKGGPDGGGPPGGGCERCAQVEKRLPKDGLGWRWNDVLR